MNLSDRILGCILGGAIGDSVGVPFEGIRAKSELPDELKPDRISDDTQMTLATCEAISLHGPKPEAIAENFKNWYVAGRFSGIGASTYAALEALQSGAHWAAAGRGGEFAAGNGAAMRIAPIAFVVDIEDRFLIRDIVKITHNNDDAYVGSLAVLYAIRNQLDRTTINGILDELPDTNFRDRLLIYSETSDTISDCGAKYGASGYVGDSVPLAIYAATRGVEIGFTEMIKELIRAGGDVDTTCSIAGQILGSHIGKDELPSGWVSDLPDRDLIEEIAWQFAKTTEQDDGLNSSSRSAASGVGHH